MDSFQVGGDAKLDTFCSADRRTPLVKYRISGDDALRVDHGLLMVSGLIWHGSVVVQAASDTKSVTAALSWRIGNQTMNGSADLICAVYLRRNSSTTMNDMHLTTIIAGLRNGDITSLQCGGVVQDDDNIDASKSQNLIMLHLSTASELERERISMRNFFLLNTVQKLQAADAYLASRSITAGTGHSQRHVPSVRRGSCVLSRGDVEQCGRGHGFGVRMGNGIACRRLVAFCRRFCAISGAAWCGNCIRACILGCR